MRTRKFWSNRIIKIVNYLNNQAEIRMEIMKLNKNFIRFLKEIEEDNLNNYDAKKDEISFWIVNHELNNYDPIGLYPCVLDEYECEADSINKAILELDDEEMKSKINDEFEGLDHIGLNENWDEARIAKDNIFLWASSIRGNEKDLSKAIMDSVPGILYLYDDKGRLVYWNKNHEEVTGYSAEEMSKMTLFYWYKGDEETITRITKEVNKAI